ncbi:PorP/SprF family type IX secretion system membrane protein [Limnovirga soli]|uniref:Type IX secretion system membrane protein PorP/SprF n=1 Tax=Limnovirga soli TaxID=2656915 RepID=A0A8J8FFX3_9BACT|nr:type IX secretion system membrane protein PorP/SprF [Limnovirga soli]NNV54369.1 type IX secretion system membrane protein PorP/SprF [Limnovirga soli]
MKYFSTLLIFCLHVSTGNCQQKAHYTQYILNQYIINPALTGIENYIDVKVSHRQQWTGLDGAPVTSYISIQGPIAKKDYRTTATSFRVPGENPRGNAYWDNYTAAEPHHGIGIQFIKDVTGPLSNVGAYATYAYHIGISPRTNLAAGMGVGLTRFGLDASKLEFNTTVDPVVYTSNLINTTKLDFNAGLYLYSSDYFIGLSAQQLIPSRIDFSNNIITTQTGKMVPHLFATAGYRFLLNENFNLTSSIMLKYIQPLAIQPELNLKLQYNDLLWTGASYRYKDGFAAMLGINVLNFFNISYSYDYSTSSLSTYTKNTHEFILGFLLNNKYADTCPKAFW